MAAKPKPPILDEDALSIFTDGSSYSGPRRGGLAFLLVWTGPDGHPLTEGFTPPGYKGATNQQMELKACIEALRFVLGRYSPVGADDFPKIDVYTDSDYVFRGIGTAQREWSRNRWMKRDGNPVRNADEWRDLVAIVKKIRPPVRFKWCKGHSPGNPFNKQVDKLAKASARAHLPGELHVARVGRKWSTRKTQIGSVRAEGQEISIRVVTDVWMRRPRMYAYKIEVIDQASPYFENVDEYFSEDVMLDARHCYRVLLNDDVKRPRIVENLGEITSVTTRATSPMRELVRDDEQ